MIPADVKKAYLSRPLQNYDWLKELSAEEVDSHLARLVPEPTFHTTPYKEQKVCFLIGVKKPDFLFFLDLGIGKSKVALDIIKYHKDAGRVRKALILAPKTQHIYTWSSEIAKHRPDLTFCELNDTTANRETLLDSSDADVFILNYAGLVYLATDYAEGLKGKKGGQIINPKKVAWLAEKFDCIVCDESQYLKNHQSLTFKIVNLLGQKARFRYALTGTPMGRNPQDLWSQFYAIDKGDTLGRTLGLYREAFFKTKVNYWGGYEHKFIKTMEPQLHVMMKNRSIWYSAEECQSLPKQVFIQKHVAFPNEIESYYRKALSDLKENRKNYRVIEQIFLQMRMLSSGFLGFKSDDDEKIKITFDENPKLDALMDIIEEIPSTAKVVVFNDFIHSGDLICARLTASKLKHVRLYSGTKDQKGVLRAFDEDPSCRIMVCNNQSGAEGLNLQVANYVVFFENPVSSILRQQGLKRCHRRGQNAAAVFYYDLLMRGTWDAKILAMLTEGRDLMRSLVMGEVSEEQPA